MAAVEHTVFLLHHPPLAMFPRGSQRHLIDQRNVGPTPQFKRQEVLRLMGRQAHSVRPRARLYGHILIPYI